MEEKLCRLTLVYPPAAEETIIELLLAAEPPLKGFTTWQADGHGLDFSEASMAERVRGRIRRSVMVIVMPRTRLEPLLETIRTEAAAPHLAYWIEPVESFGRL
jgi:Protein of unknown function (DUF3240)